MSDRDNDDQPRKPGWGQVILSTLAAAFGVQTNKNRERDFEAGSVKVYIIAGVVFTALFVLGVVLLVKLVLSQSGL